MRESDKKIQNFAREMGMLYTKNGKEYATFITANDKEMSFEYESPDTIAHVSISPKRGRDMIYGVNDLPFIKNEHPEFFQD